MTSEEFTALKEGTTERRDLQVRQVENGYTIVGVRHFLDADTKTEKFSVGSEGVASSSETLLTAITNFFTTGGW